MDNNSNNEVVYLYLDDIIPNRFQPREVFNDQALKELAVSIKEHGVIQPIIVRKVENKYEIIAGERRYKASTMAGLTKIPAIVKNLDDKESSKVALIENLQRRDLTPIEEARTYQKILELEDGMTQEQLAATMGKTQSSVSNKLRLLALPDEIQDALLKEKISERHARSLLNLEDKNDQIKMLDKIIAEKMTVRELDKEIKELKDGGNNESEGGNEVNIEIGNNSTPAIASIAPASAKVETINEGMTANDIINSPTTSVNENVNNNPETNNSSIQTFTFEPINLNNSAPENSEDTKVESPLEINPTVVDINQVRENSIDIGGNKQESTDVKELMKNPNEVANEFKFVPTFSFDDNQNNAAENSVESADNSVNRFGGFFNSNITSDSNNVNSSDNNIASSIAPVSLTIPAANNVDTAINDIKTTISNLQQNGYNISFEELDGDNNYKITITLQK